MLKSFEVKRLNLIFVLTLKSLIMNKLFFILAVICILVGYNQVNVYADVFNGVVSGFLAVLFLYCGAVITLIKENSKL